MHRRGFNLTKQARGCNDATILRFYRAAWTAAYWPRGGARAVRLLIPLEMPFPRSLAFRWRAAEPLPASGCS